VDLSKSYDYFKPEKCAGTAYILGCGAIGSTVAEMLVRLGVTNIVLYDFDKVTGHNIANQMYVQADAGRDKVDALYDHLTAVNPLAKDSIIRVNGRYTDQNLSGYVFLCVDNIDVRREIVMLHLTNTNIKAMFDFRMRLEDAQHFAADWHDRDMVQGFLNSMQFSHEEAREATPVSACNLALSVVPTVRVISSLGVANFMNFIKTGSVRKLIVADPFHTTLDAF
jgi:hypothetical protein